MKKVYKDAYMTPNMVIIGSNPEKCFEFLVVALMCSTLLINVYTLETIQDFRYGSL